MTTKAKQAIFTSLSEAAPAFCTNHGPTWINGLGDRAHIHILIFEKLKQRINKDFHFKLKSQMQFFFFYK